MDKNPDLAQELLELVPRIAKVIRVQVRGTSRSKLTLPQFRILGEIQKGASQVGKLAAFHGISQPAMSKLVEGLVKRGWVKRTPSRTDRRQVELQLTSSGQKLIEQVQANVRSAVSRRVERLSRRDAEVVSGGLRKLAEIFSEGSE